MAAAVAFLISYATPARPQSGSVTIDLGTLGGSLSTAHDVNSLGQVVGSTYSAAGQQHVFNMIALPANDRDATTRCRRALGSAGHDFGQVMAGDACARRGDRDVTDSATHIAPVMVRVPSATCPGRCG